MLASVIIPTYKGAKFVPNVLKSLANQSFMDFELVIVVKPSGDGTENIVRDMCSRFDLHHRILIQDKGYFTHALNMGLKHAKGDLLLFTDDDAILPRNWIVEHINSHFKFRKSGAISGRIIRFEPSRRIRFIQSFMSFFGIKEKPKREELTAGLDRMLRWRLLRPVFARPHPVFRNYRLGIYITHNFTVAAGPYIPYRFCLSLPVGGPNMSFKREAAKYASFPEQPMMKTAPYNEHYFGAQLVLQGWESIYCPNITVYHMQREGLSKSTTELERRLSSLLLKKLINEYCGKA